MKVKQFFDKLVLSTHTISHKPKLLCLWTPANKSAKNGAEFGQRRPKESVGQFESCCSWVSVPVENVPKRSMSIYQEVRNQQKEEESDEDSEETMTETFLVRRRHRMECVDATVRPVVRARISARAKVQRAKSDQIQKAKMICEQFTEDRLSMEIPVSEFKQARKSETQQIKMAAKLEN